MELLKSNKINTLPGNINLIRCLAFTNDDIVRVRIVVIRTNSVVKQRSPHNAYNLLYKNYGQD